MTETTFYTIKAILDVGNQLLRDAQRFDLRELMRELMREPTWEERLQYEIRRRSLRHRYRNLRWEWDGRIRVAVDSLRGRHEC